MTSFTSIVWKHYKNALTIEMPWRENHTPYYVLLSEIMLQQTQVIRVKDYFIKFINCWSTLCDLARAPLADVLTLWSGLGYYRRAKYLHQCANIICQSHNGVIPKDKKTLLELPGIGDYTSSAILSFAYNIPTVMIETNIRRAIIYHFFSKTAVDISESEIRKYVEKTMDKKNPREWYWALMDYGASLSFKVQNPNRRSKIYTKQSKFEGSNRQIRSAILHSIMANKSLHASSVFNTVRDYLIKQGRDKSDISKKIVFDNIENLCKENLLLCEKNIYKLPA